VLITKRSKYVLDPYNLIMINDFTFKHFSVWSIFLRHVKIITDSAHMVRCTFGTIYFIWNKLRCGHLGLYSAGYNIRDASYCTNFKMTNPQQIQTNGWRKWEKM
jgi:hypothetical protein